LERLCKFAITLVMIPILLAALVIFVPVILFLPILALICPKVITIKGVNFDKQLD